MHTQTFGSSVVIRDFIKTHQPIVDGLFRKHRNTGAHTGFIVKAARSRDLEVREFGMGHYFYRAGSLIGGTRQMLTTLVSSIAVSTCHSKAITKQFLVAAGVPVPVGASLPTDSLDAALSFAAAIDGPVVVKPGGGSAGDGVTCGVTDEHRLRTAWAHASAGQTKSGSILVEQQVVGLDIRAYVIGGKVVAAATRLPGYVVGDGINTVAELMGQKMQVRAENAYLGRMKLVVDETFLMRAQLTLASVPPAAAVVLLNETVNLHQGGENVDVTGIMSEDLKGVAIRAAAAVPGLGAAGVDLMVRSLDSAAGAVVLEANTKANISVHHLPAYGSVVDVGGALVDEMLRIAE